MKNNKKIYFAGPLFSNADRMYNQKIVNDIREDSLAFIDSDISIEVYLPQEAEDINDKNSYANSIQIAEYDTNKLLESDALIALIDGQVIDPGVASEIGIAYQAGIPIIGLYTDVRQQGAQNIDKLSALKDIGESQFSYVNLYTVGLIKKNGYLTNKESKLLTLIRKVLYI